MYIVSAAHISLQEPLCDNWLEDPRSFDALSYNRALEVDSKAWISPMASRRMSPIVKRAIVTAKVALKDAGLDNVDAIIAGTGLGCVENTEKFLDAMICDGEQFLQPTHFIQSTHNTIASQIALLFGCNGYNSTYVHYGISFESAFFDAYVQFKLQKIRTALVGGYDEMTSNNYKILSKINFWKDNSFAGEGGTSFVLSDDGALAMARVVVVDISRSGVELVHRARQITNGVDVQALMVGSSGCLVNDAPYDKFAADFAPSAKVYSFKNLCGDYFTASAFGLYAAVKVMQNQGLDNILFYNHYRNGDHALILLERC